MNKKGLLLCAKYSVAPNYYGYCGPDKNLNLIDHLKENAGDREVASILSEFETLYLNLRFIAAENRIKDLFDSRVVEAYWIGNSLLDRVSSRDYTYLLSEKFNLQKKLGTKQFEKIRQKVMSSRMYPHHSFHVFNIFKRTGLDPSFHTTQTMDECRISWGKVILPRQSDKKLNATNIVTVQTKPLIIQNDKLVFGKDIYRKIKLEYKRKRFLKSIQNGDWISFHWGFACDILSMIQVANLTTYTQKALDYFNS